MTLATAVSGGVVRCAVGLRLWSIAAGLRLRSVGVGALWYDGARGVDVEAKMRLRACQRGESAANALRTCPPGWRLRRCAALCRPLRHIPPYPLDCWTARGPHAAEPLLPHPRVKRGSSAHGAQGLRGGQSPPAAVGERACPIIQCLLILHGGFPRRSARWSQTPPAGAWSGAAGAPAQARPGTS